MGVYRAARDMDGVDVMTVNRAVVETRIGVYITASDFEQLGKILDSQPGLADVSVDPTQVDEIVRITIAGRAVLSIKPRRA
jgi:hypothetical protein